VRVRNDAFAKIKENIQGMVGQLDKEQKDEVTKKDDCVVNFNENDVQTKERGEFKTDVETDLNSVQAEIDTLTKEEEDLKQKIADIQIELKKAGENRETENKDFQVTISDQRATQAIVEKAMARMKEFYEKKADAASLLQVRARRTAQEPPVQFGEQKKNAGGGGVITMLQGVIDESKAVEKDAQVAENDAQIAYEQFVKDSHKQVDSLSKQLVNDDEALAKDAKQEAVDEGDKSAVTEELLKLGEVGTTLHNACDFTVDNFSTRQKSRSNEMDALKESQAIFSAAAA